MLKDELKKMFEERQAELARQKEEERKVLNEKHIKAKTEALGDFEVIKSRIVKRIKNEITQIGSSVVKCMFTENDPAFYVAEALKRSFLADGLNVDLQHDPCYCEITLSGW